MASRRAGEKLILDGLVRVNGHIVRVLGTKVNPDRDEVIVDGKIVRAFKKIYLALNKPPGCVCSHKDEHDRPTIYDLLPTEWQIVHSVGRLDFNSEGLIFLTNDGQFSLRYGVRKKYVATVEGEVDRAMLAQFVNGIWHAGEKLKAEKAVIVSGGRSRTVVELELSEGKNREVRRLFESQAVTVKRLQRIQIGKIKLGELKLGKWRTLTPGEIKTLLS